LKGMGFVIGILADYPAARGPDLRRSGVSQFKSHRTGCVTVDESQGVSGGILRRLDERFEIHIPPRRAGLERLPGELVQFALVLPVGIEFLLGRIDFVVARLFLVGKWTDPEKVPDKPHASADRFGFFEASPLAKLCHQHTLCFGLQLVESGPAGDAVTAGDLLEQIQERLGIGGVRGDLVAGVQGEGTHRPQPKRLIHAVLESFIPLGAGRSGLRVLERFHDLGLQSLNLLPNRAEGVAVGLLSLGQLFPAVENRGVAEPFEWSGRAAFYRPFEQFCCAAAVRQLEVLQPGFLGFSQIGRLLCGPHA